MNCTRVWICAVLSCLSAAAAPAAVDFGPANPFFVPSRLPFQAPPFDKIHDQDYQPAIEAGMAQQRAEILTIADSRAKPTFDNTLVPLERSGRLLDRAQRAFSAASEANTNSVLQAAKTALAPKLAAHHDAIFLNAKLFARVTAVHAQPATARLDAEARRLVEFTYDQFVHAGANLSEEDKARLKKLNEELSTLSNSFTSQVLAATQEAAFHSATPAALSGLSAAQLTAAGLAAQNRHLAGYLLPLQNTTQQPALASLENRETRRAIFENSWTRTERGDGNDTREIIARLAHLRAERAALLGYPNHAAWKIEDQMAKTPKAAHP